MNICIVEDNQLLLDSLIALLNGEGDIRVTASHASAEQALAQTDWAGTDILLADINLPEMSGIELIQRVHPLHPDLSILVYTVHEDRARVLDAIRAGACGYLIKGSSPQELIAALHEIYEGGAPMSPRIARAVLAELRLEEPPPEGQEDGRLTLRETDILKRLECGQSYKEISADLRVSTHTVHTHIKSIYRKLQAHSKAEAIRKGRIRGVL